MKKLLLLVMVMMVVGLAPFRASGAEQVSTAITYQGHLNFDGVPADGLYDFVFSLYDGPTGGSPRFVPLTMENVRVVDGFFKVKLNFWPTFNLGEPRWLEIDVRLDGVVTYTTLDPREEMTAAPMAHTLLPGAAVIGTQVSIPLLAIENKATTGGDAKGLLAETDSTSNNVSALYGRITATSPGGYSAGVRGVNEGTGGSGIGVYGSQNGSGWGVYGTTLDGAGVRGYASGASGINYGIYGRTNSDDGYAGYFWGRSSFNGNVGIGTGDPGNYVLKIKQYFSDDGYGMQLENFEASKSMQLWVGTSGAVIDAQGTTDLLFRTGGTNRLFIENGGKIGIGTTSPDSQLHVDGGSNSIVKLGYISPLAIKYAVFAYSENHFAGYFGGAVKIEGKLDVNDLNVLGPIYQRGSLLHADYVFKPGYKLESIEEHAEFMWENKHLKAIPKEKTGKDGKEIVEIGAHRKGIVEELEKAHIYIEQLHRRIEALETKMTMLDELLNTGSITTSTPRSQR